MIQSGIADYFMNDLFATRWYLVAIPCVLIFTTYLPGRMLLDSMVNHDQSSDAPMIPRKLLHEAKRFGPLLIFLQSIGVSILLCILADGVPVMVMPVLSAGLTTAIIVKSSLKRAFGV